MNANDEAGTAGQNDQAKEQNLSALGEDASHPFDQTNGIVDGLEGNADDPEEVDRRLNEGEPGTPMPGPEQGDKL